MGFAANAVWPGSSRSLARTGFSWENFPGLVWSNRQAPDEVRIRAALMKPSFPVLLAIATAFGPDRLEHEWAVLRTDPETDTQRVEPAVTQILTNIRRGYEQAGA